MKTLIDFDSPVYAIASACDGSKWNYKGRQWDLKAIAVSALEAEGRDPSELYQTKDPEPWDKVEQTIIKYTDGMIDDLNNPFDMMILVGGGGNFRYDLATIQPYKGNRSKLDTPFHLNAVKDFIVENYGAKKVYSVEVDDALGILYEEGDLIISQDKDLLQIPGKHFNPITRKETEVDYTTGLQSFYCQCIVGDTSDNIPGLYGIGVGSVYVKEIKKMNTEGDMFTLVSKLYEQRFGSYWKMFLLENCRLLWLIRNPSTLIVPMWMVELMDDYSFYQHNWEEMIFEPNTKTS